MAEYTPLGLPNKTSKDTLIQFNVGFLSARIGEWLFTVALNWVVFVQTQSPVLLAVINACRLLPTLLMSIPAGRLADKLDRRTLNFGASLIVGLLTLLVGIGLALQLPFWMVASLVVARACVTAAEAPFRNAYLCSLFSGEKLKSVVAQNASVMNFGRIVGPVLGGALLAGCGSLATFLVATIASGLYAIVLGRLPSVKGEKRGRDRGPEPSVFEILRQEPDLRKLLLLAVPVMLFGFPFTAMLPLITETLLGLGSEEFGSLLAVSAAGALLASSQLSWRPSHSSWLSTRLYALFFGLSLLCLAQVTSFYTAAIALFVVGYFGQAYRTSSRMLFQNTVPRKRAGKMLGIALMDRGLIPLGGFLVGAVAEYADPRLGVAVMGIGCLASMLLFFPLKRFPKWSLLGVTATMIAVFFLTGCQKSEQPTETPDPKASPAEIVSLNHAWGSSEVPAKPATIVVLDISFLDAFSALEQPVAGFAGTSDKVVPSYLSGQLAGDGHPKFVGERKQPNLEVILSLKPDLIVANPDRHKMIREQLETIAPTIALTDDSLEDIRNMVRIFGDILDRSKEADDIVQEINDSLSRARDTQKQVPTVLVVGAFEDEFSTWTEASFIGSLFSEMDADYLYKGPAGASESQTEVAKITVEGLAELDPQYLFVYGDPSLWESNPIYQKLGAVENEGAFPVDRDLWSRARGPLAALAIMEQYHEFLLARQEVDQDSE